MAEPRPAGHQTEEQEENTQAVNTGYQGKVRKLLGLQGQGQESQGRKLELYLARGA